MANDFGRRLLARLLSRPPPLAGSSSPDRLGGAFARLWVAETASSLGDGMRATALALLAARLSKDARAVAAVTAAGGSAWIVLALVAGAVVDRVDVCLLVGRLRLMLGAVSALLAVLALTGSLSMPVLYVTAFMTSAASVFVWVAYPRLIARVTPPARLADANGRLSAGAITMADFVAPPLAAILFATFPALPFSLDAATFGCSAFLLFGLPRPLHVQSIPTGGARASTRDVIGFMRKSRPLTLLAVTVPILNLAFMSTFAIQVLFVTRVLGVEEAGYGVFVATFAAGALLGSLSAARLRRLMGTRLALTLAFMLQGAATVCFGIEHEAVRACIQQGVMGFASLVSAINSVALWQERTPEEMLGRVGSVFHTLGQGVAPLGALLGGVVAHAAGLRAPYLASGLIYLVVGTLGTLVVRAEHLS